MKTVFKLTEQLKVVTDGDDLFIQCPSNYKDGNLSSDDLLKSFAMAINYGVTGVNKSSKTTNKNGIRTIKVVLSTFDEWFNKKASLDPNFKNRMQTVKFMFGIPSVEEGLDWSKFMEPQTKPIKKQKLDKNVALEVDTKAGNVRIYQLPEGTKSSERSRLNANIQFNESFDLVSKETHLVIVNEVATGGIIYLHNKGFSNATEADKLGHLDTVLATISEVLNNDFPCKVKTSAPATFTAKGGLCKIPFAVNKIETEKIGFNK